MTDQEKDRAWQRCRGWEGALFESGRELCGMQGRVAVRVMLFNDAVAIRVMCQFHGEMLPGAVRAEEPLERGTSVIKERRKNWRSPLILGRLPATILPRCCQCSSFSSHHHSEVYPSSSRWKMGVNSSPKSALQCSAINQPAAGTKPLSD